MDSLGQKIRNLRKERKMTQLALARGLVTPSMISQIESDKATPSQELLEQLAARLGVKPSFFADDIHHKTDLVQAYRRAKQLMEAENYAAALPLLQTLTAPVPPQFREEVLFLDLAQCYERLQQYGDAANMYEEVVRASLERDDVPRAVHAYFHLGQLERRQSRWGVARMHWQRAAELLRRHPDLNMPIAMKIYANLGRIHMQLRQFEVALESYRRAVVLAERYQAQLDHAMILHGMGAAYIELGRYELGEDKLQEAIRIYDVIRHQRGINQCHVNIGIGLRRAGKFVEAKEKLSWCIEHREIRLDVLRLANALSERAACCLELEQWDEAIADAKEAVLLDKDTPELQLLARHTLAVAYMHKNEPQLALENANLGLQCSAETHDMTLVSGLYSVRAQALWALGDAAGASADAIRVANMALSAY